MQLLVDEPAEKKQNQRLLKRCTTIFPISLLTFSNFERAVGLSPPSFLDFAGETQR